jgi:3-oxoacyl-[acyl-carrier-protein] synthase II
MRRALSRAGRDADGIDYVNAHGTGTQQNDAMEAEALRQVLGGSSERVWVSSSKAQLGHSLGASGALEAAITVLAVARGQVPPTAGLIDPERPELRHVLGAAQSQRVEAALSSSFGFGGMSCVLAFAASHTAPPPPVPARLGVCVSAVSVADLTRAPEELLDPNRSRRFDRASAFAAAGVKELVAGDALPETGLVLGTAFGSVERTMAFLGRAAERGPRHVPPAEFPHLVPSAPAGNASIYAALTGPVFAVSELAQSGEAALASGVDLLELGVAERCVVGAIAPRDAIVDGVLAPLLGRDAAGIGRSEGAAFVMLQSADSARGSGVALLLGRYAGDLSSPQALLELPEPHADARVVLGGATREVREALALSRWRDVECLDLVEHGGYHEALGAMALATAARLLAETSGLTRVLLLSGGPERFTAWLLGPPPVAEG